MAGRKNEWTKNCKNKSWPYEENPKKKMSGRKNVKTKKYTTKKRGTKNHATKECGTKICGRKISDENSPDENRSWHEMCVLDIFLLVRLRNYAFSNTLLKIIAIPKFQAVYFHWKWCRYCSWKLTVIFGSVRILANRVNCPCPEQGRNPNSQLSSAISPSILPIEPQDHNQLIHRNPVNGLIMIFRFSW